MVIKKKKTSLNLSNSFKVHFFFTRWGRLNLSYKHCIIKRGSRHAARTAKSLRWRIEQLSECLIMKITLSS